MHVTIFTTATTTTITAKFYGKRFLALWMSFDLFGVFSYELNVYPYKHIYNIHADELAAACFLSVSNFFFIIIIRCVRHTEKNVSKIKLNCLDFYLERENFNLFVSLTWLLTFHFSFVGRRILFIEFNTKIFELISVAGLLMCGDRIHFTFTRSTLQLYKYYVNIYPPLNWVSACVHSGIRFSHWIIAGSGQLTMRWNQRNFCYFWTLRLTG